MKRPPLYTLGILAICAAFIFVFISPAKSHSVEVGFTALSPNGISGGHIVPASCDATDPPTANATDYGGTCPASNSCGSGPGTYDACGSCQPNSPLPTVPTDYGTSCTTSICGQSVTGTYDCSNNCAVSDPPTCSAPQVCFDGDCSLSCVGDTCSTNPVILGTIHDIKWVCPSPPNTDVSTNFSSDTDTNGEDTDVEVLQPGTNQYTVECDQTQTQITIDVTAINPVMSLSATPSRVTSGGTSSLAWHASSVTSCQLTGPGISPPAVNADINGNIGPQTTSTGAITGQSTFTLSCQTSDGPVSTSVNVSLVPSEIEI